MRFFLPAILFLFVLGVTDGDFLPSTLMALTLYLLIRLNDLGRDLDSVKRRLNELGNQSNLPLKESADKVEPSIPVESATSDTTSEEPATPSTTAEDEPLPVDAEPVVKQHAYYALETEAPKYKEEASGWSQDRTTEHSGPSLLSKAWRMAMKFITEGNPFVRIGVVVLFLGAAFLVQYSAQQGWFPVEYRLLGTVILGAALLFIGWHFREAKRVFGLSLQGGGIAIIYLTLFASFRFYDLLPTEVVFVGLVLVSLSAIALAVLQNAFFLALTSVVGGFLAPILVSSETSQHIVLFSYYAILNLVVAGVAWFRAWRILNLVGFVITFGVCVMWGANHYNETLYVSCQLFLILFFAIYLAVTTFFTLKQITTNKPWVDGTLLFGLPVIAFALQAVLVMPFEYGLAYSALALGAVYLGLAFALWRQHGANLIALVQSYIALGIVFLTLVIPLAFDGEVTAAVWALEGAGIVWLALKQNKWLAKYFGLGLQLIAGLICIETSMAVEFLMTYGESAPQTLAFLNQYYLSALLVSLGGIFTAYFLEQRPISIIWDNRIKIFMAVWAVAWWAHAGYIESSIHFTGEWSAWVFLIYLTVSLWLTQLVKHHLGWSKLHYALPIVLGFCVLVVIDVISVPGHVFYGLGLLVWVAAWASVYFLLYKQEAQPLLAPMRNILHTVSLVAVSLLIAKEWHWIADTQLQLQSAWAVASAMLTPFILFALIFKGPSWPFKTHRDLYFNKLAVGVFVVTAVWMIYANLASTGTASPLPYLPILNPIDLVHLFIFVIAGLWFKQMQHLNAADKKLFFIVSGVLACLWLNGVLLRSIHQYDGIAYTFYDLFNSRLVQAALAIYWSVIALSVMRLSYKIGTRTLWFVGVAILAVVIIKLFTIDLVAIDTLERIVVFLIVGGVLLTVGYVCPLPKRDAEVGEK